jgi:hypothetical protein
VRNGAEFLHSLDHRALGTAVEELEVFVGGEVGNDPAFVAYLLHSMPCSGDHYCTLYRLANRYGIGFSAWASW